MEKRFWLGASILAILLLASLFTGAVMRRIHLPAAEAFYAASETALAGDLDQAIRLAESGRQQWIAGRNFTACVADHGPMDDVEDLLAEMSVFAKEQDRTHFAACCCALGAAIKAMSDAHCSAWWNLL